MKFVYKSSYGPYYFELGPLISRRFLAGQIEAIAHPYFYGVSANHWIANAEVVDTKHLCHHIYGQLISEQIQTMLIFRGLDDDGHPDSCYNFLYKNQKPKFDVPTWLEFREFDWRIFL